MTKAMDELRAELVRTGQIDPWDLRRIRWLSPERQAHNNMIMDALGWGHELSRKMRDCGEIDDHNNMRYCGVPHCSRCSMVRRGQETKKAIRESFLDIPNEQLAFVTCLLPVTTDLSSVEKTMEDEKRRLINMLSRKRRNDSRWNGVHVTGFWEIDRIAVMDLPSLSERKQNALGELGAPALAMTDDTIWIPHLHAIVDLGGVSLDELRDALRGDGRRTAYQLHVQGFQTHRSVKQNLRDTVRYCLKFRLEDGFKRGYGLDVAEMAAQEIDEPKERQWWPAKDISAYVRWAKQTKGGFQSMRFEIGRARQARDAHKAAVKAFEEDRKISKARRKAVTASHAVEIDEDFECLVYSSDIGIDVSFK